MICSVSRFRGTLGMNRDGNDSGSSPWSETLGSFHPLTSTAPVSSTIAIRGAGTTVVRRGTRTMIAKPASTRG